MKTIINNIFKENPTFILLLGLCPALATTSTVEHAYIMGLCLTLVLIVSNLVISIFRKLIPSNVRIPVYVLIIGTNVTILTLGIKNNLPNLYEILALPLSLIVVNCIVLGRAITVASNEGPFKTFFDALGSGLGFTFAIIVIALFREVLGANTLTLLSELTPLVGYRAEYANIIPTFGIEILPMPILLTPAGGFLVMAFILSFINGRKERKIDGNN